MNTVALAELARKHWHTGYALLVAELLAIGIAALLVQALNPVLGIKTIIFAAAMAAASLIWILTNRLPTTKRSRVGFVICLSVGDETERKKIAEDFMQTLHRLLAGGAAGSHFHVITIPEHRARGIADREAASNLIRRCRAHFMVFGRVRLRQVGGRNEHIIDMGGVVRHVPIPKSVGVQFAKEFTELFPSRIRIAEDNDVFSFEFTSGWVSCVARYIIGIAAALSGDFDYAEVLFGDVRQHLKGAEQANLVFAKMSSRIPLHLAAIKLARARVAYNQWTKTRELPHLAEMSRLLDGIDPVLQRSYPVVLLRAIEYFVRDRDVERAKADLNKWCRRERDGTWLYSLAFLHAYEGDLRRAIRTFRVAVNRPCGDDVLPQVEQFYDWVIKSEPEKYQLHFCLGFLNWKAKGDAELAIQHLGKFVSSGADSEFRHERELARSWIEEIGRGNPETPP